MGVLFSDLPVFASIFCLAIAMLAGVVKGMVGFAMPMILISGLSSVVSPELALAGLILPTLLTNGWQALRQGRSEAWESVKRFKVFLLVGATMMMGSAQLVSILSQRALLLGVGAPMVIFAALQLAGWRLVLRRGASTQVEAVIGALAGFVGGLSGIWGPPTVMYLTAIGTEKREQMRVQGVIYSLGAVVLTFAHTGSGVLNGRTVWLSAALIVPSLLGMWLGLQVQDRIDHNVFRRVTLVVLLLAGANLIRRAVM